MNAVAMGRAFRMELLYSLEFNSIAVDKCTLIWEAQRGTLEQTADF
jgi:hypothetical protein